MHTQTMQVSIPSISLENTKQFFAHLKSLSRQSFINGDTFRLKSYLKNEITAIVKEFTTWKDTIKPQLDFMLFHISQHIECDEILQKKLIDEINTCLIKIEWHTNFLSECEPHLRFIDKDDINSRLKEERNLTYDIKQVYRKTRTFLISWLSINTLLKQIQNTYNLAVNDTAKQSSLFENFATNIHDDLFSNFLNNIVNVHTPFDLLQWLDMGAKYFHIKGEDSPEKAMKRFINYLQNNKYAALFNQFKEKIKSFFLCHYSKMTIRDFLALEKMYIFLELLPQIQTHFTLPSKLWNSFTEDLIAKVKKENNPLCADIIFYLVQEKSTLFVPTFLSAIIKPMEYLVASYAEGDNLTILFDNTLNHYSKNNAIAFINNLKTMLDTLPNIKPEILANAKSVLWMHEIKFIEKTFAKDKDLTGFAKWMVQTVNFENQHAVLYFINYFPKIIEKLLTENIDEEILKQIYCKIQNALVVQAQKAEADFLYSDNLFYSLLTTCFFDKTPAQKLITNLLLNFIHSHCFLNNDSDASKEIKSLFLSVLNKFIGLDDASKKIAKQIEQIPEFKIIKLMLQSAIFDGLLQLDKFPYLGELGIVKMHLQNQVDNKAFLTGNAFQNTMKRSTEKLLLHQFSTFAFANLYMSQADLIQSWAENYASTHHGQNPFELLLDSKNSLSKSLFTYFTQHSKYSDELQLFLTFVNYKTGQEDYLPEALKAVVEISTKGNQSTMKR